MMISTDRFRLVLLLALLTVGSLGSAQQITELSPTEFYTVTKFKNVQLLDIQSSGAFEKAHIRSAINLDFQHQNFESACLSIFDPHKKIYIYSFVVSQAKNAALFLQDLGFKEVYYMAEGFSYWTSSGLPYVSSVHNAGFVAAYLVSDLKRILQQNKMTFVYLYQPSCKYCKLVEPVILRNTGAFWGIKLLKIDISKDLEIAEYFQAEATPTFVLFNGQKQVWKYQGEISEEKFQAVLFPQ